MKSRAIFSIFVSLLSAFAVAEESILPTGGEFKTSFETLTLPGNEQMGFMGGQLLYELTPNLSIGPAAYGALTGDRGGFITLGGALDASLPLSDSLSFDAGYFVGAGGGRGGLQLSGGGLMLRSYLGFEYSLGDRGSVGLGVSHQDFPNGSISSTQPYLTYTYPFSAVISDGWSGPTFISGKTSSGSEQDFSLVTRHYEIPSEVTRDNGAPQYPSMQLMGAEWTNYLDHSSFIRLESNGAMGGQSNGYMQILLGAGVRKALSYDTALKIGASVGVAGGGGVDTGGGLLIDAQGSIQHMLTDQIFIEAGAGYLAAPQAGFEAMSLTGKLGYKFATPTAGAGRLTASDLRGYTFQPLRVRAVNQSYRGAAEEWRTFSQQKAVENLGVQLDYFSTDNLFLTGQGIAAYEGDAGAYMAGLLGGGVHLPLGNSGFYLEGEGLIGAAGGGGIAVGSGLVWQANAQLGYELTDSLSLTLGAGRLEAVDGPLRANTINAGLAYKFGVPVRRWATPSQKTDVTSTNAEPLVITGRAFNSDLMRETLRVEKPTGDSWPSALVATHRVASEYAAKGTRTLEYEVVEKGHSIHMVRLKPDADMSLGDLRDASLLPPRDIKYQDLSDHPVKVNFGLDNRAYFDGDLSTVGGESALTMQGDLHLTQNSRLSAKISLPLISERPTAGITTSGLEAVRSGSYNRDDASEMRLEHLALESRGTAARFLHYRLKGGLLEAEYAGVGAEALYWPHQSRLAVGVSAGAVKQRVAGTSLDLLDYSVLTGQASLYWASPFANVDAALHLGRYLAGDWGGTLELRRTLSNGWMYGVYASLTDESKGYLGLDNTEHGLFLRVPLDVSGGGHWLQTRYDVDVRATPRDAGARLDSLGSNIWWDLREARFDVFRGY